MIEIAGGIILAVLFFVFLPHVLWVAAAALALAAAALAIGIAVHLFSEVPPPDWLFLANGMAEGVVALAVLVVLYILFGRRKEDQQKDIAPR